MKKIIKSTLLLVFLTFIPAATASAADLSVYNSDPAKGTITGTGFNCGSDCSESVADYSTVTLTATPNPGYVLSSGGDTCPYSGTYSGAVNCDVTMTTAPRSSWFIWAYASYTFTATVEGTGSGTVSGTGTYPFKSSVTLTAHPNAGSVFAGWQTSGDICFTGGGKGAASVNTSPTCNTAASSSSVSTFNAVARFDKIASSSPSAPSTRSTSPNSSTTAPPSTTPEPAKPTTPTLDTIVIDGKTIKPTDKVSLASDEPLVLKGKTVPSGKVTLYVFSDPKKYTITADASGNWSYTVKGLAAGNHHAEIEVTDPATNKTSDRAKLLAFTVTATKQTAGRAATTTKSSKGGNIGFWISVAVVIAALGAIGFILWKRKKANGTGNFTPKFPL